MGLEVSVDAIARLFREVGFPALVAAFVLLRVEDSIESLVREARQTNFTLTRLCQVQTLPRWEAPQPAPGVVQPGPPAESRSDVGWLWLPVLAAGPGDVAVIESAGVVAAAQAGGGGMCLAPAGRRAPPGVAVWE